MNSVPGKACHIIRGVEFHHGSWAEVKEQAGKENKLIFMDFYTVWCTPCKQMLKEVFTDPQLGDYYNQHLISVKLDAEKGEGIELARKYGVGGFPTFIFVNASGEEIYRVSRAATIKEMMTEAAIALTPREDFDKLKAQYEKGVLGKDDLYRYLVLVRTKGDRKATARVFETWFSQYAAVSANMFDMIATYSTTPAQPAFQYLLANRKDFSAAAGKDKVDAFISRVYLDEFRWAKKLTSDTAYRAAKKQLAGHITIDKKLGLELDMAHYLAMNDEKNYMKAATTLFDRYYKNDDEAISLLLGSAQRIVKDKAFVQTTRQWALHALSLKDNSLNNLSLALVYAKEKNREMAVKYVDASLAVSKRDNDGYAGRIEMFKKDILDGKW